MNTRSLISVLAAVLFTAVPFVQGAESLPRSTPEAQGISSKALFGFVEALDKIDKIHKFMGSDKEELKRKPSNIGNCLYLTFSYDFCFLTTSSKIGQADGVRLLTRKESTPGGRTD